MQPRRAQQPISFRSDKAAARLALLTRGGRSQAEIIEEALDLVPEPPTSIDDIAARLAELDAITRITATYDIPTMAEFDAETYDEHGLLR